MKDHIRPSTRPARNSRDAVHSWKMPGLRRLPDESWEQRECGKMTMISNLIRGLVSKNVPLSDCTAVDNGGFRTCSSKSVKGVGVFVIRIISKKLCGGVYFDFVIMRERERAQISIIKSARLKWALLPTALWYMLEHNE